MDLRPAIEAICEWADGTIRRPTSPVWEKGRQWCTIFFRFFPFLFVRPKFVYTRLKGVNVFFPIDYFVSMNFHSSRRPSRSFSLLSGYSFITRARINRNVNGKCVRTRWHILIKRLMRFVNTTNLVVHIRDRERQIKNPKSIEISIN